MYNLIQFFFKKNLKTILRKNTKSSDKGLALILIMRSRFKIIWITWKKNTWKSSFLILERDNFWKELINEDINKDLIMVLIVRSDLKEFK